MTTAYLALGSNTGNRLKNLQLAVRMLETTAGLSIEARSHIYETESVEGGGPDNFLNAAVRISTGLSVRELLDSVRAIESRLGRPQPPRHGPRLIDIDILLYGDVEMDDADLTIPHPRMHRRAFVLKPLLDVLDNGWVRKTELVWDR